MTVAVQIAGPVFVSEHHDRTDGRGQSHRQSQDHHPEKRPFPVTQLLPSLRLLAHETITKLRPVVHKNVVARITNPWTPMADEPTADTRIPAGTTGGELLRARAT